jgi:hypothetical protein
MIARMPPAQLALAGICGALSLVFAYEIAAPISPFDVPKSAEVYRPAPVTFEDTANAPSAASFDDINAHPIFSASRAPIASHVDVTHGGTSSAFPTDVSLIGVIIEGQTRMALVKTASEPFARSVPQGGEIEGWTVSEVDPDKIVLSSGASKQEILLAANQAAQSPGLSVSPNGGAVPNIGPAPSPNFPPAPNTAAGSNAVPGSGAGTTVSPNSPPASNKPSPDASSPAPHQ